MNDINHFVDTTLTQNLSNVRNVQNTSDILIRVEPCASLKEGEIAFIKDGFTAPWEAAGRLLSEIHNLGIHLEIHFPEGYNGDVKFVPLFRQEANLCKFAAPWYVDLYINKSQADPQVKLILNNLNKTNKQNDGRFIFRGEQSLYPSVKSTLERYWETDNKDALRATGDAIFDTALKYLHDVPRNFDTSETRESIKMDVLARIQHMGGATNLVDFSTEIWVALFFACVVAGNPKSGEVHFGNTGRIWKLDRSKKHDGLEICELSNLVNQNHNTRLERQSGVSVIPDTGTIPSNCLEEVVRIEPQYKNQLNEFLQTIGISTPAMYNDLEGYMRHEQGYTSLEALSHMMMGWLSNGELDRVLRAAESLIRTNKSDINTSTGYYFRGLHYAFCGQLGQAFKDMNKFGEIRNTQPECVGKNLTVVQNALKNNGNRNFSKKQRNQLRNLKERICMDLDDQLWSVTFPGYTYREI